MHSANKNNKRLRIGLHALRFVFAALIVVAIFLNLPKEQTQVYAGTDENMSGYAWSGNIGWISFNCIDAGVCAASNYGVHIDDSQKSVGGTGDFSGHAWSSNIGWISFNRADTGNPPKQPFKTGSGPIAQIDWSTGNMTGWARAIATDGNGWDGWIKLSGGWANGALLDMSVTPNEFKGYAWGSDVVGWIGFNCADAGVCSTSNYKVSYSHINLPPVAPNFEVSGAYRGIERTFNIVNYGALDPEGNPFSIVSLSSPSEGNAIIIGATGIGYTNTSGTDGQDSFTYTISNGSLTDTGIITTIYYGYCGDSTVNSSEECDGNTSPCLSIGPYTQGTATCNISCNWNIASCLTQCGDTEDNDTDGKIDAADPGCWSSPTDPTTYNSNNTNEDNCGNGYCESSTGETRLTCPADCKARIEEF